MKSCEKNETPASDVLLPSGRTSEVAMELYNENGMLNLAILEQLKRIADALQTTSVDYSSTESSLEAAIKK